MTAPIPTFATVKRSDDTITVRTKARDADPKTVTARIINGELVLTGNARRNETASP
jgi:hypothetical protein